MKNKQFSPAATAGFLFAVIMAIGMVFFTGCASKAATKTGTVVEENNEFLVMELPCTRDGYIYGQAYIPKGNRSVYPTVIVSHGFTANYRTLVRYCEEFAREGIASYAFDFIGGSNNSKSGGSMKDMSVLTEVSDLNMVIDFVKTLDFVDTNNLFLLGESQGGLVSALTAAKRENEIQGMVLVAPAFVIPDYMANISENDPIAAMVGSKYVEDALSINLYDDVRGYTKKVLILHGDNDSVVPLSYAKAAADAYRSAELVVIEGGGHGFNTEQNKIAMRELLGFLKGE
jgi:pimeloyl-ACP methyl ester carboxylesterase